MGHCSLNEALEKLGVAPEKVKPQQKEIIDSLLNGNNVLGILPTGFGKSLCFQAPAMSTRGTAIVFSPLISLMNDQVQALKSKGVSAEQWNSTITVAQKRAIKEKFEHGELDLLYIAPEALDTTTWKDITLPPINYVVIDEVHCISQWGFDFRPHYLLIKDFIKKIGPLAVLGCSATIDAYDLNHINREIPFHHIVRGKMTRPNLRYVIKNCPSKNDDQVARDAILYRTPMVIFCSSRKKVENLHAALEAKKPGQVGYYHGEVDSDYKSEIQDKFLKNKVSIMVATNAFGQGVDKPDIRTIVHADIPLSLTYYVQESGRAGRDGQPSNCILYYPQSSMYNIQHYLIDSKNPSRQAIEKVFGRIVSMGDFCVATQREIAEGANVSEYAMPAILAALKKYGLLETKTIFKKSISVDKKAPPPSDPYLKVYNTLQRGVQNLEIVSAKLDWDLDEVEEVMEDLVRIGSIRYVKTDNRARRATMFRIKGTDLNKVSWAELEAKRKQHMARFGDMLAFAETGDKHGYIENYFGRIGK